MGCLVLRMPRKREEIFSSGAPAPPPSVCLERPLPGVASARPLLFSPFPGSPSSFRNSRRGDGTARKEVLKNLFLSKKSRMSVCLCRLRTVSYLPRQPSSAEGRGAERGRGLLGSFPPRFAYFAMSALNKNSREAERYLSIMGSATGSSPCIPCGISGVTAAMA